MKWVLLLWAFVFAVIGGTSLRLFADQIDRNRAVGDPAGPVFSLGLLLACYLLPLVWVNRKEVSRGSGCRWIACGVLVLVCEFFIMSHYSSV